MLRLSATRLFAIFLFVITSLIGCGQKSAAPGGAAPPTVTTVNPSSGSVFGGTVVTLTGTNFKSVAEVKIGGSTCPVTGTSSATQVTCTAPAHSVGAVDVVVTNPDATTVTTKGGYTYLPDITVSPSSGSMFGGTLLTITGTGTSFSRATTVTVGGVACQNAIVLSATQITCRTPAGHSGTVSVALASPALATTFNFTNALSRVSTNATVFATAYDSNDGSFYLGGDFTLVKPPPSGNLIQVNAVSGAIDTSFDPGAGFNGAINQVGVLSTGAYIVVGSFTQYRGSPANYVAKLSAAGDLDTTFNPPTGPNGTDGAVSSVAISATDEIFLGGVFSNYRSAPYNGLAKLNSSGVATVGFAGSGAGNVLSLALDGLGNLYVAGSFTTVNGLMANNVAKLAASNGALDTVNFNPNSINGNGMNPAGAVYSVVYNPSTSSIYFGGFFSKYRNATATNVVKADGNGVLDTTFNPGGAPNGTDQGIYSMATAGANLFLGGRFSNYRGAVANHVAMVNSTTGVLDITFNPPGGMPNGTSSDVRALAISGTTLYIGGLFSGYQAILVSNLAKADITTGNGDATFSPGGGGPNSIINSISAVGSKVLVGGAFSTYRATTQVANYIAKFDAQGNLDTTFSPQVGANGTNGSVYAITVGGGNVYFGGNFQTFKASMANNIAKASTAGVLDTTFSPQGGGAGTNGFDNQVNAIALSTDSVYAGGLFTHFETSPANRIAKLSFSGNLDLGFNPGASPNGTGAIVRAIAVSGSDIYFGGDFTTYRTVPANHVVKTDPGGVIDTTFSPGAGPNGTDQTVSALAVANGGASVYMGGAFGTYRGATTNYVAKASSSGVLDTTFNPGGLADGTDGSVYGIALSGTAVYLAGTFSQYRGTPATNVAMLNTSGVLNTTFSPASGPNGTSGQMRSVSVAGSSLLFGGATFHYRGLFSPYVVQANTDGTIVK